MSIAADVFILIKVGIIACNNFKYSINTSLFKNSKETGFLNAEYLVSNGLKNTSVDTTYGTLVLAENRVHTRN